MQSNWDLHCLLEDSLALAGCTDRKDSKEELISQSTQCLQLTIVFQVTI